MSNPHAKSLNLIRWILAGSIILFCLGYVINTLRYSDRVFTFLWSSQYLDSTEQFALRVSEWGALGMLFAAFLGSIYRFRGFQLYVFLWIAFTVICSYIIELWHPAYLVGAAATRMASPLLLLCLPKDPARGRNFDLRILSLEWGMRLAIALTFFFHGHECLAGKAQFLDYLQAVVRLLGIDGISSASALATLKVIGILDILVAIAILVPRRLHLVAGWMAFWGLATAFVRIIYAGWGNYPEFLLRIIHGTLPICILILWLAFPSTKNQGNENLK